MKKIKQDKAITLVALVITIIVLLILAGITITLVLGDNGILNRAVHAGQQYQKMAVKEKIELAIADIQTEEVAMGSNLTMDKIIEKLPSKVENLTIRKDGAQAKGTCDGYVYTVKRNFEVVMEDYEDPIKTILSLNKEQIELYPTQQETLIATVEQTENKEVLWNSTNPEVAVVDNTGKVIAKGKGETQIVVTTQDGSNISQSCLVSVWWSAPYNTRKEYSDGTNTATIPKGFQVSLKEEMNKVIDGLVVRNASDKNEFVWVPTDLIEGGYSIKDWNIGHVASSYKEDYGFGTENTNQIVERITQSVTQNKGFYIGRYETGTLQKRTALSAPTNDIVIRATSEKEKVYAYNCINWSNAIIACNNLYTREKDEVESLLTNCRSWDTALKFIEQQDTQYPKNSENKGWYSDNYTDNLEFEIGKPVDSKISNKIKNIYDMGGNVGEWVADYQDARYPGMRGGYNTVTGISVPASIRNSISDQTYLNGSVFGFRISVYL